MDSVEYLNTFVNEGFAKLLGLTITHVDEDTHEINAMWEPGTQMFDGHGGLHNGAVSSVAETLASIAGGATTPEGQIIVGVSNTMNFFHGVAPHGPLGVRAFAVGDWDVDSPVWRVRITTVEDREVAEGEVRLQRLPTGRWASAPPADAG